MYSHTPYFVLKAFWYFVLKITGNSINYEKRILIDSVLAQTLSFFLFSSLAAACHHRLLILPLFCKSKFTVYKDNFWLLRISLMVNVWFELHRTNLLFDRTLKLLLEFCTLETFSLFMHLWRKWETLWGNDSCIRHFSTGTHCRHWQIISSPCLPLAQNTVSELLFFSQQILFT